MKRLIFIGLSSAAATFGVLPSTAGSALSANFTNVICSAATGDDIAYQGSPYAQCSGSLKVNNLKIADSLDFLNGDLTVTDYNDNPLTGPIFGGLSNWKFDAKLEDGSTEGDNDLDFDISPIGATSGEWGFMDLGVYNIVLELKASQGVSYYYFEGISGSQSLDGIWSTAGISTSDNGNNPGLSHASLFYTQSDATGGPITAVPEPATILGSVLFLGAGTVLKRRKRSEKSS